MPPEANHLRIIEINASKIVHFHVEMRDEKSAAVLPDEPGLVLGL